MSQRTDFGKSLESLFQEGLPFDKFLQSADAAQRKAILDFLEQSDFSDVQPPAVPVRILFFGELWCPDCVINGAALAGILRETHGQNLDVRVQPRDGNEQVIMALGDGVKARIPTIVALDGEGEPLGVFVERPSAIRALESTEDQLKRIAMMKAYRAGGFVTEAAREIMEMMGN